MTRKIRTMTTSRQSHWTGMRMVPRLTLILGTRSTRWSTQSAASHSAQRAISSPAVTKSATFESISWGARKLNLQSLWSLTTTRSSVLLTPPKSSPRLGLSDHRHATSLRLAAETRRFCYTTLRTITRHSLTWVTTRPPSPLSSSMRA